MHIIGRLPATTATPPPTKAQHVTATPLRHHPAPRSLRALIATGAAATALVLAACGAQQGAAGSAQAAPQTAATQPGEQGTSVQVDGDMDVVNARIPAPSAGSATAQVEMTLADTSTMGPDTLRAASSPAARAVVFFIGGLAVPRIVVPVAAGAGLSTGPPNPDRIVLTGLRHPLRAGQLVTISLVFARAGRARLQVPVIPPVP